MAHLLHHTNALLLLAAVFWLPGYVIESRWLSFDHGLRQLARIALGLGFWIAVLFALAAAGLLRLPAILVVAGGLGLAALDTARRGRQARSLDPERSRPRRSGRRRGDRITVLAIAALAAVLAPFYLLALTPTVSWDASVYHLTLPKLFIAHGGFREVPFNVYSNWPLSTELLFTAAMLVKDYVLAKLVHFGFGLLVLYAVYAGCRRFHRPDRRGRTSGWLAMAFFLANGVVLFELRVAYVDLAHAFFFTAAFLFLMRSLRPGRDADRALLLAGLCAGVVAGIKLSGIAGAAILAALYLPRLVAAVRAGELRACLGRLGMRFALPVAVFWVPWLVKSAWYTGNPWYPLLFGGPYWSPALGEKLAAWQRAIGMGREPLDYVLLPLRVILEGGAGYGRFDGELGVFWIAALPIALWAARYHWLVRRALAAAGLYFVFWASTSQQMRLLIPALPLLSIAGAVGAVEIVERLPWPAARPLGRRLLVLGSLSILVWTAGVSPPDRASKPTGSRTFAAAAGALKRYLSAEDLRQSAVHPVYGFVGTLPEGARLLMLNTNQGFFCDREVVADSFFEASQISDWLTPATTAAELRELLAEEGITHLLIESRDRGIAYPETVFALLADPEQAAVVYRSGDGRFTVVELH